MAKKEKRVVVDSPEEAQIIESQAGGFRHRHDGLAYRLHLKDRSGLKRPIKRIKASSTKLNLSRKMIYMLRMKIRKKSFHYFKIALKKSNIDYFDNRMKNWVILHDFASKISLTKIINKLKKIVKWK